MLFKEIENASNNDLLCADLEAYQKMIERIDEAKENGGLGVDL